MADDKPTISAASNANPTCCPAQSETMKVSSPFFECSPSIEKIAPALVAAQSEMAAASKSSENPHFKSKYADLASFISAVREPLTKNGIYLMQMPSTEGKLVKVRTVLLHSSSQWIGCELSADAVDTKPQSVGSAITYLKRYSLSSITGVAAEEDDDGNLASGRPAAPPSRSEIVDPKDPVSTKRYEQQVQSAKTALGQPRK